MGKRKILVLSASIGTGHISAAQAIERALLETGQELLVRHEDALEFANPAFRNVCRRTYADLANNAPELLGWLYDYADRVWTTEEHGIAFERWNSGRLRRLMRELNPDIVVCTHQLPADMTSWLICKSKINALHAVVTTDFDINPLWLCHHYSLYFVAIEETKRHLSKLGYDESRIIVSGIPVSPEFAREKNKREMRLKHGLDPNKLTILVSAGGAGLTAMQRILSCLGELQGNLQIVAICGKNQELKEKLETSARGLTAQSGIPFKIVGFTKEMDEYMAASDLLVGKAGGLTSSEALSKGLVLVIVNPIPGQEERNSDHLLEEGAAIRCNNLPALSFKISQLLENPARIETMRQQAKALGRPFAAAQIAEKLLSFADEMPLANRCLVHPAEHKCSGFLALPRMSELLTEIRSK